MRKKSQFWSLKTIILLLVVFIILFYLTNAIVSQFIKSGSSRVCLLSVIATSKTRGSSTEMLSLECYTNFVGDMKAKGRTDEQKKDYIMRGIADLSYECWMQFGEGNYDVFSGKQTSKTAHCFICSKFNIDPKINKITSEDFVKFLKDNHIGRTGKSYYAFLDTGFLWKDVQKEGNDIHKSGDPLIFVENMNFNKLEGSGVLDAFFSYLTGTLTANFDILMDYLFTATGLNGFDELKPNEAYAIVYRQVSDEYWKQMWVTRLFVYAIDLGWEAVSGEKIYEGKIPPARLLITKYENVKDLGCDMLMG